MKKELCNIKIKEQKDYKNKKNVPNGFWSNRIFLEN